jgi:gliding motility-associated-like protein
VLGNCSKSDTIFITLLPSPDAAVQPADTTIEVGESVALTGAGDGAYRWSPASGLSCTDCPDPTASPDSSTTYLFQVIAGNGCIDTAFVTVTVTPPDCKVLLPNAFTPNGDSANDTFQVLGKNVEMRTIAIYNRWGEEVYSGSSAWDGRVDGLDAPSDVYVYAADIRVCGEDRRELGQITLIR